MDSTNDDSETDEEEINGWLIEHRLENYLQNEKYTAAPDILKPMSDFVSISTSIIPAKNTPNKQKFTVRPSAEIQLPSRINFPD